MAKRAKTNLSTIKDRKLMDILADVLSQLTISKEVLHKNGYYDQVEDFKVKTTDSLADDVKKYFREEREKAYH